MQIRLTCSSSSRKYLKNLRKESLCDDLVVGTARRIGGFGFLIDSIWLCELMIIGHGLLVVMDVENPPDSSSSSSSSSFGARGNSRSRRLWRSIIAPPTSEIVALHNNTHTHTHTLTHWVSIHTVYLIVVNVCFMVELIGPRSDWRPVYATTLSCVTRGWSIWTILIEFNIYKWIDYLSHWQLAIGNYYSTWLHKSLSHWQLAISGGHFESLHNDPRIPGIALKVSTRFHESDSISKTIINIHISTHPPTHPLPPATFRRNGIAVYCCRRRRLHRSWTGNETS